MFPWLFLLELFLVTYIILAIILAGVLRLMAEYFKRTGEKKLYRTAQSLKIIVLIPAVLGPVLWLDATGIEPNWIEVKTVSIRSFSFPPDLKALKIVQISDLHVEKIGFRERSLIRLVNHLDPDLILITGDFVNSKAGWRPAFEVLGKLKAKRGIYTILGNTDYYFAHEKEVIPQFQELGIEVLLYEKRKLDFGGERSFWLVGVSDKYAALQIYGQDQYVQKAFENIPLNEPKILLIHDPNHADSDLIAEYRPQLILAGDTHGGQVGIKFIRQFSDYAQRSDYMSGYFEIHGIPLYVNRGIGMKTLNIRFLCRPEITVVRLLHEEDH